MCVSVTSFLSASVSVLCEHVCMSCFGEAVETCRQLA